MEKKLTTQEILAKLKSHAKEYRPKEVNGNEFIKDICDNDEDYRDGLYNIGDHTTIMGNRVYDVGGEEMTFIGYFIPKEKVENIISNTIKDIIDDHTSSFRELEREREECNRNLHNRIIEMGKNK